MIHHLSAIDNMWLEECFSQGLEYVWKNMHCSSIMIKLHHYMQNDGKNSGKQKMQSSEKIKQLLRKHSFRWKTLHNTTNGDRVELWESLNGKFRQQINPETAVIYRKDLQMEDLYKETVTIQVQNLIRYGPKSTSAPKEQLIPSISSIVHDLIRMTQQMDKSEDSDTLSNMLNV